MQVHVFTGSGVGRQREFWKALEQRLQRHHAFHPGQARSEAHVDAATERHVLACVGPEDIEDIGLIENRRIAIGAAQQQYGHGPGRQRVPFKFARLGGDPSGDLHGRVVTQDLLDGVGPAVRVFTQMCQLLGMAQQCGDTVADQVDRGFEAGTQQQRHRGL